jgi:hypothetical protein
MLPVQAVPVLVFLEVTFRKATPCLLSADQHGKSQRFLCPLGTGLLWQDDQAPPGHSKAPLLHLSIVINSSIRNILVTFKCVGMDLFLCTTVPGSGHGHFSPSGPEARGWLQKAEGKRRKVKEGFNWIIALP